MELKWAPSPSDLLKNDLLAEVLTTFGQAHIKVTGTSMLPAIFPGDLLLIRSESIDRVLAGQIVLFTRESRLWTHRVLKKAESERQPFLITQGDASRNEDPPVFGEHLLGVVVNVSCADTNKLPWDMVRKCGLRYASYHPLALLKRVMGRPVTGKDSLLIV